MTGTSKAAPTDAGPVLLSGGNPQIAKADGDAPVQAYIAAMPGWKLAIGRQLDAFVVRKAERWNTPGHAMCTCWKTTPLTKSSWRTGSGKALPRRG